MTKALCGHMKGVNDLQDGDSKAKKAKAKIKKEKAVKTAKSSASKKGKKEKGKKEKKKREISEEKLQEMREKQAAAGTGYHKLMQLSPALASLLGQDKCSRPQVVKLLWVRIRERDLQNPEKRNEIILDSEMKKVFGCDTFTMFSMNKYISEHVSKIEPTKEDGAAEAKGDDN